MNLKPYFIVLSIVCAIGLYFLYRLASLCLSAYDLKTDVRRDMIKRDTVALRIKPIQNDTIIQNSY